MSSSSRAALCCSSCRCVPTWQGLQPATQKAVGPCSQYACSYAQDFNGQAQRLTTLLGINREQVGCSRRLSPSSLGERQPHPCLGFPLQGVGHYAAGLQQLFNGALACAVQALQVAAAAKQPLLTASSQHSRCARNFAPVSHKREDVVQTVLACSRLDMTLQYYTQHLAYVRLQQLGQDLYSIPCAPSTSTTPAVSLHSALCTLLERLHLLDAMWRASNAGPTTEQGGQQQQQPQPLDGEEITAAVVQVGKDVRDTAISRPAGLVAAAPTLPIPLQVAAVCGRPALRQLLHSHAHKNALHGVA